MKIFKFSGFEVLQVPDTAKQPSLLCLLCKFKISIQKVSKKIADIRPHFPRPELDEQVLIRFLSSTEVEFAGQIS